MSGLPELKPKYTSRRGANLGQNSCPQLLSMSRTRSQARSECSELSQEGAEREDRHGRKVFREYIQGIDAWVRSGLLRPDVCQSSPTVANYFVGRMLEEEDTVG